MEAVNYSYKRILAIALPILVSVLMEQLVGMTDTAYLGRVGEVELGAAALGGIAYTVVFLLGLGFSIGVQIIIGRRNGARSVITIGWPRHAKHTPAATAPSYYFDSYIRPSNGRKRPFICTNRHQRQCAPR